MQLRALGLNGVAFCLVFGFSAEIKHLSVSLTQEETRPETKYFTLTVSWVKLELQQRRLCLFAFYHPRCFHISVHLQLPLHRTSLIIFVFPLWVILALSSVLLQPTMGAGARCEARAGWSPLPIIPPSTTTTPTVPGRCWRSRGTPSPWCSLTSSWRTITTCWRSAAQTAPRSGEFFPPAAFGLECELCRGHEGKGSPLVFHLPTGTFTPEGMRWLEYGGGGWVCQVESRVTSSRLFLSVGNGRGIRIDPSIRVIGICSKLFVSCCLWFFSMNWIWTLNLGHSLILSITQSHTDTHARL